VNNNFDIISPNITKIQSVSTIHNSGKTNDDVIAFHVMSKTTQYFPSNLESFYKNIEVIFVRSSHLKELHSFDLKPFTKLNEIYMDNNDIEILEEGLFKFSLDLKSINLYRNKIYHIHATVFDNLSKLTYLMLSSNKCISVDAQGDQTAVRNLISQTKSQCQDSSFISLDNQIKSLKEESKNLNSNSFQTFRGKIENLDSQVKSSKFSNFTSMIITLQDLKNIEKPETTTTTTPKASDQLDYLKMPDTCSSLNSKFDGFSLNFSSVVHENLNIAKNAQSSCINETISYFDEKFSSIYSKISAQSENSDSKLSKLDENIDQANFFDKISSFDEKLLNFDKKLSIFDEKFGTLDEKLSDFDEKLTNLGEKTTIYEEYLSEFQSSVTKKLAILEFEIKETRFKMLKSNELRHGQLELRFMKKIENIEKILEEKVGKIMKALSIEE